MSTISKKICMIGDFGVGKTSLIRRFVEQQFSDRYLTTVGVRISRKTVELAGVKQQEKLNLQMLIWDIEGSTKFKAIAPNYLQGASGVIIVSDCTREDTIEHFTDHVQAYLSINPKGYIISALNKTDLVDKSTLETLTKLIESQEQQRVVATYETSAKTGKDVDRMFEKLAYTIIES